MRRTKERTKLRLQEGERGCNMCCALFIIHNTYVYLHFSHTRPIATPGCFLHITKSGWCFAMVICFLYSFMLLCVRALLQVFTIGSPLGLLCGRHVVVCWYFVVASFVGLPGRTVVGRRSISAPIGQQIL